MISGIVGRSWGGGGGDPTKDWDPWGWRKRCCCSTKKVAVLDFALTRICCALLTYIVAAETLGDIARTRTVGSKRLPVFRGTKSIGNSSVSPGYAIKVY